MIKLKLVSTYKKTLLLIFISSFAFIILFLTLFFYTFYQEKEVKKDSVKQFNNEVNTLLQLNSESHKATITDITYWDEFVNFMQTKDKHWFQQSISPSLSVFNADYFVVYDLNEKMVMDSPTKKVKSIDFMPKIVFKKLYKDKLVKFYINSPNGIIEVFGATIHPSNDPFKNKTKPSGYFF